MILNITLAFTWVFYGRDTYRHLWVMPTDSADLIWHVRKKEAKILLHSHPIIAFFSFINMMPQLSLMAPFFLYLHYVFPSVRQKSFKVSKEANVWVHASSPHAEYREEAHTHGVFCRIMQTCLNLKKTIFAGHF